MHVVLEWFAADAGVRGVLDLGCFLLLCSSPGVPNLGLDFLGAPSGIYPPLGSAVRPLQVQSRPSFQRLAPPSLLSCILWVQTFSGGGE